MVCTGKSLGAKDHSQSQQFCTMTKKGKANQETSSGLRFFPPLRQRKGLAIHYGPGQSKLHFLVTKGTQHNIISSKISPLLCERHPPQKVWQMCRTRLSTDIGGVEATEYTTKQGDLWFWHLSIPEWVSEFSVAMPAKEKAHILSFLKEFQAC